MMTPFQNVLPVLYKELSMFANAVMSTQEPCDAVALPYHLALRLTVSKE